MSLEEAKMMVDYSAEAAEKIEKAYEIAKGVRIYENFRGFKNFRITCKLSTV
jgi:hypothetical protein